MSYRNGRPEDQREPIDLAEHQRHIDAERVRDAGPELLAAPIQSKRMIDEALPKFNWGASALDANAIRLLNETPGIVAAAITKAEQPQ